MTRIGKGFLAAAICFSCLFFVSCGGGNDAAESVSEESNRAEEARSLFLSGLPSMQPKALHGMGRIAELTGDARTAERWYRYGDTEESRQSLADLYERGLAEEWGQIDSSGLRNDNGVPQGLIDMLLEERYANTDQLRYGYGLEALAEEQAAEIQLDPDETDWDAVGNIVQRARSYLLDFDGDQQEELLIAASVGSMGYSAVSLWEADEDGIFRLCFEGYGDRATTTPILYEGKAYFLYSPINIGSGGVMQSEIYPLEKGEMKEGVAVSSGRQGEWEMLPEDWWIEVYPMAEDVTEEERADFAGYVEAQISNRHIQDHSAYKGSGKTVESWQDIGEGDTPEDFPDPYPYDLDGDGDLEYLNWFYYQTTNRFEDGLELLYSDAPEPLESRLEGKSAYGYLPGETDWSLEGTLQQCYFENVGGREYLLICKRREGTEALALTAYNKGEEKEWKARYCAVILPKERVLTVDSVEWEDQPWV